LADGDPSVEGIPSFETDSDEDLLGYMAMAGEDSAFAREAWAELIRRHSKYLYGTLIRRFGRVVTDTRMVEDIVQDTFRLAFERATTFASSGTTDRDGSRRIVRAWLGTIAKNVFADTFRRDRSVRPDLSTEEVPDLAAPVEADSESDAASLVADALATLSERERDVLRVSMLYFSPGAEHQRLPNAVSKNLGLSWNTTPQNIRAIRHRALMKVRQFIESKSKSFAQKKDERQ
jgi:RNA polymerase sigma factor (sigma-70 family)